MMIQFIMLGLMIIGLAVIHDWNVAHAAYNIKHNGYRWVVRDNKGRFVAVTGSFWSVLKLGASL